MRPHSRPTFDRIHSRDWACVSPGSAPISFAIGRQGSSEPIGLSRRAPRWCIVHDAAICASDFSRARHDLVVGLANDEQGGRVGATARCHGDSPSDGSAGSLLRQAMDRQRKCLLRHFHHDRRVGFTMTSAGSTATSGGSMLTSLPGGTGRLSDRCQIDGLFAGVLSRLFRVWHSLFHSAAGPVATSSASIWSGSRAAADQHEDLFLHPHRFRPSISAAWRPSATIR